MKTLHNILKEQRNWRYLLVFVLAFATYAQGYAQFLINKNLIASASTGFGDNGITFAVESFLSY